MQNPRAEKRINSEPNGAQRYGVRRGCSGLGTIYASRRAGRYHGDMQGMSLQEALVKRTSCREFDRAPIADDVLQELIRVAVKDSAGHYAFPSAHDRRPLTLLVASVGTAAHTAGLFRVTNDAGLYPIASCDIREDLVSAIIDHPPWLSDAPVVLAVVADDGPMLEEFAYQSSDGLRGRDFVMIEAGALIQSLLLVAASLQLGAVFLGGIDHSRAQHVLKTDQRVIGFVAVGAPGSGSSSSIT